MIDILTWPVRFFVDPRKLTAYLLDPASDDGASKGRYLLSYGFSLDRPDALEAALLTHADETRFIGVKVGSYGLKFRFDGSMPTPNGAEATVLTVWQVDAWGDGTARFVTTRPSRRGR